jgi:hypothetical protein
MYGSKPGHYLLVGPNWKGETPKGIVEVFHSSTDLGVVIPRVFVNDDPADKQAIQPLVSQIVMYPLSQYDGKIKTKDWGAVPKYPNQSEGKEETKWVVPEKFFSDLPSVLDEVAPLPGEEAIYANVRAVLDAASNDDKLKVALKQAAADADKELVTPLFQFRNSGLPLPHNWSTVNNGAAFGIDYLNRTAAAKANIFVNKPNETKYFYQDLDEEGESLNGDANYAVTFPKGQLPPVRGFWSLTLYNQYHFFAPNAINRYSIGTKNRDLKFNNDGSLTIYVRAEPPQDNLRSNWLPSPKDATFVLYMRAYWPEAAITGGQWTPPGVQRLK